MNFCIVYKTALNEGGLLLNGYYVDQEFPTYEQFSEFAPQLLALDLKFSGDQSEVICAVSVPAGIGQQFPRDQGRVWSPIGPGPRGERTVATPLPWRWTMCVNYIGPGKTKAHHIYHDSVSREMVEYNHRGDVVMRFPGDAHELETSRYGSAGGSIPNWLHFGMGGNGPGQALFHVKPREIYVSGISIRNKERRSQALIFNRALDFQRKIVYGMQTGGQMVELLRGIHAGDTGHWIGPGLKTVTNQLMGTVVALAQAHKDNNEDGSEGRINGGAGWNVRWGPTGASIEDALDGLKDDQEQDQKYLQKFPTMHDVQGDEYFENADAHEWMDVADKWANRIGGFGLFDFLNTDQEGLSDMSRLDNFTPLYPDMPTRVNGLPRPPKNPERKVALPGLLV